MIQLPRRMLIFRMMKWLRYRWFMIMKNSRRITTHWARNLLLTMNIWILNPQHPMFLRWSSNQLSPPHLVLAASMHSLKDVLLLFPAPTSTARAAFDTYSAVLSSMNNSSLLDAADSPSSPTMRAFLPF